ncbi:L-2-hydroxyglutarate oxidase [Mycolicibacterium chlorophenolicum]|uniref:L-2-hydroxyglutarate oxidase LhgO n=1 Tax=Mycolicibacterium chlorophenolicum TaxID=37916 RepID=A0A0J6WNW6_9MYCO|nr:L-2-hydroxyglutarate oxidase [Mycolicibacterium chlorophenolicum]KMO83798.1 L-2-hydroxyglutarate oxidase LhgO [Mycolicibacterium chlorophenolicum]
MRRNVVVVGAGIVGLAVAHELQSRGHQVVVVDKERRVAQHQTGRNSGVIHSGLYYAPGSHKAAMATAGAQSMRDFARQHDVAVDICGKLVVATNDGQVAALRRLLQRGQDNGVPVREIGPAEARDYEPNVSCVAALRVESTGIVDFRGVSQRLADMVTEQGGEVRLGEQVTAIGSDDRNITVRTTHDRFRADYLVNCAGLHADRLARLAGMRPAVRIVPFRGEYFELTAAQRHLVKGLIYPVPDPGLPFLGVHLTKMIGGGVHAGPNAVLALAREGYTWTRIQPRDVLDYLRWPGLWRLCARYWRTGIDEVARSLSRRRFVASLQELVPAIDGDAIEPSRAGVRAQALYRDGRLVEDFHFEHGPRQTHVLNAPSPAATASLEIARSVADVVDARS